MVPSSHLTRFWPVPEAATKDPRLNRSCLAILGFLTSFWNTTGKCFPLLATIQDRCSMSRRTVLRCLKTLDDTDWIKRRSRGRNHSNDYLPGKNFTRNEVVPTLAPGAKNGTHSRPTTSSRPRTRREAEVAPAPRPRFRRRPSGDALRDHASPGPGGVWCGGSDAFFDDDGNPKH